MKPTAPQNLLDRLPPALAPALRKLDPADWLQRGAIRREQSALAAEILRRTPEQALATAEDPLTAPAIDELAQMIAAFHGLPEPENLPEPAPALASLRQQTAEDLCLLAPDGNGSYRLIAGAVCFPSRWCIADKIGLPLAGIHAPVPGYARRLEGPLDRLFVALTPEQPLARENLSLEDTDRADLFTGGDDRRLNLATPQALFVRAEFQTLRRLPHTGVICFTILIRTYPLLQASTGVQRQLLQKHIDELPPDFAAYKSFRQSV